MAPNNQSAGNSLDLVNIKEIRESTIILKDGGLKQVIMVGGVNFALKSEAEQNLITQGYQNFLNGIDFPLQIVIHSRKVNIEKYIEELLARKEQEDSPLLRNQMDEYAAFIKGFVEKNAIMEKSFLVVVPFYPTSILPSKSAVKSIFPFFGSKKGSAEEKASDDAETDRIFHENLAQLSQRVSQAVNGLYMIGLEASVLNDEALIELFYNFYNPQTIEKEGVMPAGR